MSPNDQYRTSEVIHGWRGERSETSPQPAVNNFAGDVGDLNIGWLERLHFRYPFFRFSAPAGQVC